MATVDLEPVVFEKIWVEIPSTEKKNDTHMFLVDRKVAQYIDSLEITDQAIFMQKHTEQMLDLQKQADDLRERLFELKSSAERRLKFAKSAFEKAEENSVEWNYYRGVIDELNKILESCSM